MDGQTIFLLRHGHIDTGASRLIGQTDIDLSPEGIQQAWQCRAFFSSAPPDGIFCSDLVRSRQTAEIIADACQIPIKQEPAFREINLGLWDGLTRQEIDKRFPGGWERRGRDISGYWPPGGESFADLDKRVIPAFTAIAETGYERTLIVTHAGVIRIIIAHVLKMHLKNIFRIAVDYAAATVLIQKKDGLVVQAMNHAVPVRGLPNKN